MITIYILTNEWTTRHILPEFWTQSSSRKSQDLSLQAPFHSQSLPHGLRTRTNCILLLPWLEPI